MQIGDLLAQISGGKSTAGSAPGPKTIDVIPSKRKPDHDDLRGDGSKASRRIALPGGAVQTPSSGGDRSALQQQPYTGSARRGNTSALRARSPTLKSAKPCLHSRPAPSPVVASSKAPPKKGSFAEILARGQRAQATMGQVGKIQHKKVEKGATKKARDDPPPAASSKARTVGGYTGTSKPGQRNGVNGHKRPSGHATDARSGTGAQPPAARGKAAPAEEEAAKKVKKAAQATTGYTGTARPKPGNPTRKNDTPRGGALLHAPRHAAIKNSRLQDDYDEDLDDFIEYDDEEEGGPRYGYDSEGSSDMEAGLDELDKEERRAEFIGRKEDLEEERLEKTLKAAKEDRKRKALEALRARRR
ncbi:Chromatin SPT2 [Metarhizium album ARSEF 1941]|uniref:Chromatin SPT2 n=1 Tax=Metarhizium album (strain ARSEF 1941) TaxID=1081103 RepID=A0A0B2X5P1_METAS|nr:Chromatin SPT2 [Metarhizium album ARSEF 1941]KHO00631.1 Chromatin SPT2 [Metarhizium album ARSEF 1941]